MAKVMQAEQLLTVKDVAARCKVTPRSVWDWVNRVPHFPKPLQISKNVTRWRESELEEFLAKLGR